jgi:hypothetical protein
MRPLLRAFVHHLKWWVRCDAFFLHLRHHLAAFFASNWMIVRVLGSLAQADLQAGKLWQLRVLDDILAPRRRLLQRSRQIAMAENCEARPDPACVLALGNAYLAYGELHAGMQKQHSARPQA